jgi:hypothetical protein
MSTKTMKHAIAFGAACMLGGGGAFALSTASPSWAMPVLSNTAAVRTAGSNQVTDIRYYRRGYYGHGYYGHGYGRGYYGGGYNRRGYRGYPYTYAYPYSYYPYSYSYAYPYSYSYPFSFGFGWGGW